jgi:hypothetical protein
VGEVEAEVLVGSQNMRVGGPVENPALLPCDRGFLWSFREQTKDFHDLLRQKPSSMFIPSML